MKRRLFMLFAATAVALVLPAGMSTAQAAPVPAHHAVATAAPAWSGSRTVTLPRGPFDPPRCGLSWTHVDSVQSTFENVTSDPCSRPWRAIAQCQGPWPLPKFYPVGNTYTYPEIGFATCANRVAYVLTNSGVQVQICFPYCYWATYWNS